MAFGHSSGSQHDRGSHTATSLIKRRSPLDGDSNAESTPLSTFATVPSIFRSEDPDLVSEVITLPGISY